MSSPDTGPPHDANAGRFGATHWSVVLAAAHPGAPGARQALETLCQAYWFPLYSFVRRKGYGPEEAGDLTQEFFARLLEKNYVQQADPARGRFRTFLLAAMSHFLANEWNRENQLRHVPRQKLLSWDAAGAEERSRREPFHELTPEKLLDRRWALQLLERAYEQLRREYAAANKRGLFEVLEPCLSGDSLPATYVEVGRRLNMTEGAVKVAVYRMRRTYGELLRLEIAQTVASPQEVDDELRYLFEVLRG